MSGRKAAANSQRAWQRMLSGRRLDLLDPSPLDVEVADIAHGLARVARWNGQTVGDHAYSVAQHSLLVEDIVGRLEPQAGMQLRLAALFHDAPEYVIGDMISPFKAVIGDNYKAVESRLQQAIHIRLSLPGTLPADWKKLIKRADQVAAFLEATQLAGFERADAERYFGRPGPIGGAHLEDLFRLSPDAAQQAQSQFLSRASELGADAEPVEMAKAGAQ
ncbi:YfbR-like 5'-deoxynucleotidase [Tepidamorphus sp. 3E244]|uniref:YfbR-like 5'-deoxynucleotidase n=1 Tax=Tepidamorphus sp. 3E244 TaxID=3385498 RepID=UPI0038FC38DD